MSALNDRRPVEADLTAWARGHYPTEAATHLLIHAFGGRFIRPGWPWIAHTTTGRRYIDATRLGDEDIGMLSGGEQRVLAITRSLLGQAPVDLSDALPGLDPPTSRLAIDALTHATGAEVPAACDDRSWGILADVTHRPQRQQQWRGIGR